MTNFDLSALFFLQLAFILGACRLVGLAAKRVGQSQVVSEMIAGVLIGPSLLGSVAPSAFTALFPKESMRTLFAVSQVGLALYMFLVGLEFEVDLIRRRLRSAMSVSLAGIVVPFSLGCVIASFLAGHADFFSPAVGRLEAMLFLGASMSITAFPMLARIISERGLSGTSLGTLALAAGSMDDAAAWCVLAIVLASFAGDPSVATVAIGGAALYAIGLLTFGRPLLRRLGQRVERDGGLSGGVLTIALMLVMLGSWFTDAIRIYAVFGAFLMGVAMPRGRFAEEVRQRVGPLTTSLLLPLFFAYSGLNTRIGLVNSAAMWGLTVLVLLAATVGKGVACFLAARLNGEPTREALAIGTLMNARGLMELIILNIGLERGIIQPTLFTIMVMMAVVTTLMATPIFELVYGRDPTRLAAAEAAWRRT